MLILCDFDGTITEVDVTDIVWNTRIDPRERERMVNQVTQGRWDMQQYIGHGYGFVQSSPGAILDELRGQVRIRAGWNDFLSAIRQTSGSLHIVSNGLDFYIREYVPAFVPISSFVARFDAGRYGIELPEHCTLSAGEEFKVNRVKQLKESHPGLQTIYIGDGRADHAPAMLCSTVFAVKGSRLAQLRAAARLATHEFVAFDSITEYIATHIS